MTATTQASPDRLISKRATARPGVRGPRIAAQYPVELYSEGFDGPLSARSRDLGLRGMCVESRSMFALRSLKQAVLQLPGGRMLVEAQGVWQRFAKQEGAFLTGVSFGAERQRDTARLWDLVVDHGSKLARFLYGRGDCKGFGIEELLGICHASRLRHVAPGEWIYHQSSLEAGATSIFVVWKGSVALRVEAADGRPAAFDRLEPGRLFGGMPLVADVPPPESAVAKDAVALLEITPAVFETLSMTKPWLAQCLSEAVTRVYGGRASALLARTPYAGAHTTVTR